MKKFRANRAKSFDQIPADTTGNLYVCSFAYGKTYMLIGSVSCLQSLFGKVVQCVNNMYFHENFQNILYDEPSNFTLT